jgi:hypothetical protein
VARGGSLMVQGKEFGLQYGLASKAITQGE